MHNCTLKLRWQFKFWKINNGSRNTIFRRKIMVQLYCRYFHIKCSSPSGSLPSSVLCTCQWLQLTLFDRQCHPHRDPNDADTSRTWTCQRWCRPGQRGTRSRPCKHNWIGKHCSRQRYKKSSMLARPIKFGYSISSALKQHALSSIYEVSC